MEDLEQEMEIEQDRERRRLISLGDAAFYDMSAMLCESPSFFQTECIIDSVRFSHGSSTTESCLEVFCGGKARVWKPSDAIDDSTGEILDGQLTYDGMRAEIQHMNECHVGDQMSVEDWKEKSRQLQKEFGTAPRLITTRWVTTAKADKVRARIVIRDMNHREGTARNLGISSPTPSADSLMIIMLSVISSQGCLLGACDVSHAFMHTFARDVMLPFGCRNQLPIPKVRPLSCGYERPSMAFDQHHWSGCYTCKTFYVHWDWNLTVLSPVSSLAAWLLEERQCY